jgi:nitronate monooxygenase
MSGLPVIIQGGMGAGVSSWRLAQAVSKTGQLGVVSGTALEVILARRLQDGDPGGDMRRGLDHFPFPAVAERVLKTYYIPGGKPETSPYKTIPMHTQRSSRDLMELCIAANFVEVFLAREGHGNPVGINYLEKVQLPHLPSIYGAMLAGVEFVLMGAGIPVKIPGVLDAYANHQPATYPLYVSGAVDTDDTTLRFDPREFFRIEGDIPPLKRPKFLAIIASNTLALTLIKKSNGKVDGFIIEGPTAGGHNAPPRGKLQLTESGEPIYGERDEVDLEKMRLLGLPFWLAGGYSTVEKIAQALAAGAAGVQIGTAFAFCEESGLRPEYKRRLLEDVSNGTAAVFTDPASSPTGFPFKAAQLAGSNSEREVYEKRPRICDIGHLREGYRSEDGRIGFRCSAEPVANYASKGGTVEATVGKKCLCNALLSNIGQPQIRKDEYVEQGLVTTGDDLVGISRYFAPGSTSYSAADVIHKLMPPAIVDMQPQVAIPCELIQIPDFA